MKYQRILCLALLLTGCATSSRNAAPAAQNALIAPVIMVRERWVLFDSARLRTIPVMLYLPARSSSQLRLKPTILSHGYGGRYTDYSFIAHT